MQTLLLVIGLGLAGLVGAVILLLTGWPFWVSTAISVLLLAMLLPVAFAGTAHAVLRPAAPRLRAGSGIGAGAERSECRSVIVPCLWVHLTGPRPQRRSTR